MNEFRLRVEEMGPPNSLSPVHLGHKMVGMETVGVEVEVGIGGLTEILSLLRLGLFVSNFPGEKNEKALVRICLTQIFAKFFFFGFHFKRTII